MTMTTTIDRDAKKSRASSALISLLQRWPRLTGRKAIALVIIVLATSNCTAATILTINQSLSSLTLSGFVDHFDPPLQNISEPITAQSPGSLTTALSGTLSVSVNQSNQLTISTVQLTVQNTPGVFTPGNVPANFAGQIVNPEYGGNSIGYIAGLLMSLSGTNLPLGGGGTFSAQSLAPQYPSTTLTWVTPSIPFTGTGTQSGTFTNVSNGTGTYVVTSPTNQQLTIPLDLTLTTLAVGQLAHFEFKGQIVASVPEPATGSLVVAGTVCTVGAAVLHRLRRCRSRKPV